MRVSGNLRSQQKQADNQDNNFHTPPFSNRFFLQHTPGFSRVNVTEASSQITLLGSVPIHYVRCRFGANGQRAGYAG